jgi:hypothetical protein
MLLFRLGLAHPIEADGSIVADDRNGFLYAGWFAIALDGSKTTR